jgi:translation initiation factor 4A
MYNNKDILKDTKTIEGKIYTDVKDDEPEEVGNYIPETSNVPVQVDDFEDMKLSEPLFMGVHQYGFKHPSPIQSSTIPIILNGADLIAQSQSGTGKTGAFVIGSLSRIDPMKEYPQVIIVANTKDLASQITKVTESLAIYMDIKVCLCVGGHKNTPVINAQKARISHVLVGTPGRLGDLLKKRAFDGKLIRTFVMDESDVLLKEDFREQIENIISYIGKNTQICVFSATFTKETLQVTENFLNNPYRITIEKEKLSLERVRQYKINVRQDKNKLSTLIDLYSQLIISQMIIFVNSVRSAEYLRNKLMDDQIEAGMVHGKMSSVDRENVLKEFRLANLKTLITTDVMCRGIDIDNLKMVINYDMAREPETYIHRVGRSGRYGGEGVAINFYTYNDMALIKSLERNYNIYIDDMPHPEEVNECLTGMVAPSNKVYSSKMYD